MTHAFDHPPLHPDPLCTRVQAHLSAQQLWHSTAHLIVAVSGGTDSLALLHILWQLRTQQPFTLHVAHFDHQLRGSQSAAEAAFVADTATAWQLPVTVASGNLPAQLGSGINKAAAARTARYRFLATLAAQLHADAVLLAHHADDQAETVLLHLLHGSGSAGLRGMQLATPWSEWSAWATPTRAMAPTGAVLLRPLLATRRAELEAYCIQHQLEPRHDPSNYDQQATRNRIRHHLLPILARYNTQISAVLGRTAELLSDDYAYIQRQLDQHWPALATVYLAAVHFDATHWHALDPTLQRYALRRAVAHLTQTQLSAAQIKAGCAATTHATGYQHALGAGLVLRVEHGRIVISDPRQPIAIWHAPTPLPQLAHAPLPVPVPSQLQIAPYWQLTAELLTPPANLPPPSAWELHLAAEQITAPLWLRWRQAGDRLSIGTGSRRVQDLLVDAKVPRSLRPYLPLLWLGERLIWVVGVRADPHVLAQPHSPQILCVRLTATAPSDATIQRAAEANDRMTL